MSVLPSLLASSTAIGTEKDPINGEEKVLWRTTEGFEFTTSFEDAVAYGPKK